MYTSASAHTSINFKIQSKFIYAIIAIIVLMSAAYFLFTKSGGDKLARNAVAGITGEKVEKEQTQKTDNSLSNDSKFDPNIECRKGENVEKPECVKWFNDLSKNGSSLTSRGIQTVLYNPSSPYDDLSQNLTYEITSKPVFSGCAKFNGKYYGYTEQGTKLPVSKSDCVKLIEDGDRPYNYFKTEQSYEQVKQDSQASESSVQANSQPETIPQVDPQVKSEQIPLGTKPPQVITSAHSL